MREDFVSDVIHTSSPFLLVGSLRETKNERVQESEMLNLSSIFNIFDYSKLTAQDARGSNEVHDQHDARTAEVRAHPRKFDALLTCHDRYSTDMHDRASTLPSLGQRTRKATTFS